MNYLQKVKEFMIVGGQYVPDFPDINNDNINKLRINLLKEEIQELEKALENNDIVSVRDALVDIQYVLSGAVLAFGLEKLFDNDFKIIHENNMTKFHDKLCDANQTIVSLKQRNLDDEENYSIEEIIYQGKKYYVVKNKYGKIMKPFNYESVKLEL